MCLVEKYEDKLYSICCDPTGDRTRENINQYTCTLIDNSFEFNWEKNNGIVLQLVLIYQPIKYASWYTSICPDKLSKQIKIQA